MRKIELAKWKKNISIENTKEISADAVTNCLKTRNNTLSLWRIDDETQLDNALVAIASSMQHLDRVDITILEEDLVEELNIRNSEGRTPYVDFKDQHFDIVELNYGLLGDFSKIIVEKVKNDSYKSISRQKIKNLLIGAISDKKISFEDISPNIQNKLSF